MDIDAKVDEDVASIAVANNQNNGELPVVTASHKYQRSFLNKHHRFILCVPEGTTELDSNAFQLDERIVGVTLPNSLVEIGDRCFSGCLNLKDVSLPNSVKSMGYSSFSECINLTRIVLPNSLTSIGESAFYGCGNLIAITIPDSVVEIEDEVFQDCSNLKYVAAPAHIVNDPNDIFERCPCMEDDKKGLVLSTPATRLQVMRLQYFQPTAYPKLFYQEQRDFVVNMILIAKRFTAPAISKDVMIMILQQIRIHDLGVYVEPKRIETDDEDEDDEDENENED